MDDKRYLLSLIREGEHQQQDFKYRVADACKLAKSVSAFANTDGGRLLIGVRDDGHLSGVRSTVDWRARRRSSVWRSERGGNLHDAPGGLQILQT